MQPSVNLDANLKSDHVQVFVLKMLLKILKLIPKDTKIAEAKDEFPFPTPKITNDSSRLFDC